MKIIAVIENKVTDGGGFNQSLSAILQMDRICKNDYDFEATTSEDDHCLIVSTHSSLAIDKHLEGRPVLFVNNKECLAYNLNDFQANKKLIYYLKF